VVLSGLNPVSEIETEYSNSPAFLPLRKAHPDSSASPFAAVSRTDPMTIPSFSPKPCNSSFEEVIEAQPESRIRVNAVREMLDCETPYLCDISILLDYAQRSR